jgi:hypothetical protein
MNSHFRHVAEFLRFAGQIGRPEWSRNSCASRCAAENTVSLVKTLQF